jgi:hypothetical protein
MEIINRLGELQLEEQARDNQEVILGYAGDQIEYDQDIDRFCTKIGGEPVSAQLLLLTSL